MKAKTGDDTTDAVYQDWYKSVYLPTAAEGGADNASADTPAVASETAAAKSTSAKSKA